MRKWWEFLCSLRVSLIVGRERKKNETVIHRNRSDRLLKNDSNSRSFARACVCIRSLFLSRMFARWLKNIRFCLSREKRFSTVINKKKERKNSFTPFCLWLFFIDDNEIEGRYNEDLTLYSQVTKSVWFIYYFLCI
jgi:hypothetical protein